MLDEAARERQRTKTVDLLLEMRAAYLAGGANPLKHWDQLQDRLRAAARTSSTVAEWVTQMSRSLGLSAPSSRFSEAVMSLDAEVADAGSAWLDLLESEWGLLMAMSRQISEQRKKEA